MLLVSLCAVGVMVGCGKNKTPENINTMYIEIKTDKDNEHIFKKDEDGVVTNQLYITYLGEMSKLDEKGAPVKDDFSAAHPLYVRYYALKYFQQGVLTCISEYYDKYCTGSESTSFYGAIKLKDVEKSELNALFDATESLKTDIRKFEVARKKVEDDVNVMTFTGAIRSNLTEYSYQFNRLIESYSKFVNMFRDMQVKYLYDNNKLPDNIDLKIAFVNRLRDEFYLNAAQAIYYKALKSFDRTNECDLSDLPIDNVLYKEFYNILNKAEDYNSNKQVSDNDAKIEEFLYAHNAFLQKFEVYKKVYDTLDYYSYNQKVIQNNETELENYKKVLSDVDQANIALIETFEGSLQNSAEDLLNDPSIFGEYRNKFKAING